MVESGEATYSEPNKKRNFKKLKSFTLNEDKILRMKKAKQQMRKSLHVNSKRVTSLFSQLSKSTEDLTSDTTATSVTPVKNHIYSEVPLERIALTGDYEVPVDVLSRCKDIDVDGVDDDAFLVRETVGGLVSLSPPLLVVVLCNQISLSQLLAC